MSTSAKRSQPSRRIRSRNQRVQNHLALVNSVAGHYAARTTELRDDLHQVAVLGLIRAAERYDSHSNVPFPAFARPHIRGGVCSTTCGMWRRWFGCRAAYRNVHMP